MKVTDIDWDNKKIALSIRALIQPEEEQAEAPVSAVSAEEPAAEPEAEEATVEEVPAEETAAEE